MSVVRATVARLCPATAHESMREMLARLRLARDGA
jgi:hypothetical protein